MQDRKGCRTGRVAGQEGMQDRWDAGQERSRTGEMKNRSDLRHEGCGQEGCRTGRMQDRKGCRTGRDAGQEGIQDRKGSRTGGMRDRRDAGQER